MKDRITMLKWAGLGLFVLAWAVLMIVAWTGESRRWSRDEGAAIARAEGVPPAPPWMPDAWRPAFRDTFAPGRSGSALGADLAEMRDELPRRAGSSDLNPWVDAKSVRVRRDFLGRVFVDLRVNKPVCVLKNGAKVRYASLEGVEMDLALPPGVDPRVILDGKGASQTLCIVQVEGIREADGEQRRRWVRETVRFVDAWNADARIAARLRLDSVAPQVYQLGGKKASKLLCAAEDLAHRKMLRLDWGINSEEKNAPEDKTNREKRDDLARIVSGTSGPIPDQDLRFGVDFF